MPSLIAYSCSQFAQTNFPLSIAVSISNTCRSFSTCVGSPSTATSESTAGASSGRVGSPSCITDSTISIATETPMYLANQCQSSMHTSCEIVLIAGHSRRGRMLRMKTTLSSVSTCSSSASCGWRGKAVAEDLHALRAHVKKFNVSSFMLVEDVFGAGAGRSLYRFTIILVKVIIRRARSARYRSQIR